MDRTPKNIPARRWILRGANRRVAALSRRPDLRVLTKIASGAGQDVWIVGGALRDLLLGRPAADVDVAVSGDAGPLARALERLGFGRAVTLSTDAPRVFRIAGRRELDLVELEGGSITADLERRDFTVNAVAFDLSKREWMDPFGGLRDLTEGRLRLLRAQNLKEDPLRVLRAARLFASHGLAPDPETGRICRLHAPALQRVAPERIRTELAKLLEASRVAPALRWAARTGVLPAALGTQRGRRIGGFEIFDCPVISRSLAGRRRRLRLGLLCSRLGFSPSEAAAWLLRRRFSGVEAAEVSVLLTLAAGAVAARSATDQWRWVQASGSHWRDALTLARILSPQHLLRINRLARRVTARRKGPRVRGSDILAWLEIPPGPAIGELLRELEVETLRGRVRSRRQAREWLMKNRDAIVEGPSIPGAAVES